jgi:hypothetical protein
LFVFVVAPIQSPRVYKQESFLLGAFILFILVARSPMQTRSGVVALLVVVAVLLHGLVGPTGIVVDAAAAEAAKDPLVGKVLAAMQAEQVQRSLPFQPFPLQWRVDQGLYRSEIHLNFVGQGSSRHPPPSPAFVLFVFVFVFIFS